LPQQPLGAFILLCFCIRRFYCIFQFFVQIVPPFAQDNNKYSYPQKASNHIHYNLSVFLIQLFFISLIFSVGRSFRLITLKIIEKAGISDLWDKKK